MGVLDDLKAVQTTAAESAQPPRIGFYNGVRAAKTGGSFYVKAEELGGLVPATPWAPDDRFDGEEGFSAAELRVAVIGWRSQPFIRTADQTGREQRQYIAKWEPGAQILTEALCLVEGIDGPVIWSMKGLTGKAVTGKGGIVDQYRRSLLGPAGQRAGRTLALWSFWLPIATARSEQNAVVYTDTGHGSHVTPPALFLPGNTLEENMDALFVGRVVLERGEALLHEYHAWFYQKRGGSTEELTQEPTGEPRRNVPTPIGPDELIPF